MQTALFIDYLRTSGVAVISVTEGQNTMDEGHDRIIGIRLTAPYSLERRAASSQRAKKQQNW